MMRKANHTEDILPPLPSEEYEALKAAIADHGVDVPILIDQHKEIIDGKHRRRACEELDIECPTIVQHVESEAERLRLRLELNCNRRHLNRKQKRAMIATYLKADPQIGNPELGEIVGVSKNTVESVRKELERTSQIDHFEVLRGKDLKYRKRRRILSNTKKETDHAADIVSELPDSPRIIPFKYAKRKALRVKRQREREEIAANAPPWNDRNIQLHCCRFQELPKVAGIKPGSVRLMLTDPPYNKGWLPQWDDLGRQAAEDLEEGGLLVSLTGIHCLDEVMVSLRKHLSYVWMFNCHWSHSANKQYLQRQVVLSKWRPILVFSKNTPHLQGGFCDTLNIEGQAKEYHDWQQPLPLFERLVEDFTRPGDLIVDPCGGAFTTAVACHRLKRRFAGCDIDEECVRIGAARLHDERNGKRQQVDSDKPVVHACNPRREVRTFREAVRSAKLVMAPTLTGY